MTYHEYLIEKYEDALFALLFYEMTLFNETNQIANCNNKLDTPW